MMHKLKSVLKSSLNAIEALIIQMLPTWTTIKYMEYDLVYNRGNALIKRLKKDKGFENNLVQQIVDDLSQKSNPIFLDIGSNIGLVSVAIHKHVPHISIHSFEPGPVQRQAFQKTLEVNGIKNIKIYPFALSDKAGTVEFHTHHGGDQAKDGIRDTKRGTSTFTIPVEVKTLDEWWSQSGKIIVDAIKIDTEGAELLVLRGARELLETLHPVIYIEIEPRNFVPYGYTAQDVIDYVRDLGYRVTQLPGSDDTFIARVQ